MNELEFQEEWLSAYLDDELTNEQRQVVEQRLAIDPAAHATLEDLQRVRAMVAKLPSWSGPDLKFAIPAELPGNFDEADDELVDEFDDKLEDFEEVPRLIAGVDDPRVSAVADAIQNSDSHSTRSMLGWIAMAASVLLVAGMGYLFWPPSGPQFASLDLKRAPSIAGNPAPGMLESEQVSGLESRGLSSNGDDALGRVMEFGSPTGLGGAKTGLALDSNLSADAPAEGLPPPSPANAPRSRALREAISNSVIADDYLQDKTQMERSVVPAPAVYFARSQSWMDEETQSSLSNGANEYSANQLAFGNYALQRGANQTLRDINTESVLMAAIKPEAANSPEFFQNIIVSNQLIAVDQQPGINQLSATDRLQSANSGFAEADAANVVNAAPMTAATNTPASNLFSSQRFQMAMPNSPQGNSFVLFLNRDEANNILNQLQEKGQVSSQVWRVIKQPESQAGGINGLNMPAAAEPQKTDDKRIAVESVNRKAESTTNEKVILMLNGPPN